MTSTPSTWPSIWPEPGLAAGLTDFLRRCPDELAAGRLSRPRPAGLTPIARPNWPPFIGACWRPATRAMNGAMVAPTIGPSMRAATAKTRRCGAIERLAALGWPKSAHAVVALRCPPGRSLAGACGAGRQPDAVGRRDLRGRARLPAGHADAQGRPRLSPVADRRSGVAIDIGRCGSGKWCRRAGLNCRPRPYQGRALPLSYGGSAVDTGIKSEAPCHSAIRQGKPACSANRSPIIRQPTPARVWALFSVWAYQRR